MHELDKYLEYLPVFLVAFVSSLLLTPIVGHIAKQLKVLSLPASMRKPGERGISTIMNTIPIPRLGGLAVIIPFVIISFAILPFNKELGGVILGILILAIGGVLDDKYNLPGKTQLLFQIAAAVLIVLTGTGIEYIRNPFGTDFDLAIWNIPVVLQDITYHISLPTDLITIVWLVLVMNAMNWVAGIDGLVEGISGISATIITLLSVRFFTHDTAVMGAALAGGIWGFFPFNFNPAKIYSGSAGVYVYGFVLGTLSMYSGAKFATAIMLLGIPIIDALWVTLLRIRKYKPRSFGELIRALLTSGKVHLHHRLMDMGYTVKQVGVIEYSIVAILGITAFLLSGMMKAFALVLALVLITIFVIYTSQKTKTPKPSRRIPQKQKETPEQKYAY